MHGFTQVRAMSWGGPTSCTLTYPQNLFALRCALGSFEGIDLGLLPLSILPGVRGKIALTGLPLDGWVRVAGAIPARRQFHNPLAAFTLFNDDMAGTTVKATPGF